MTGCFSCKQPCRAVFNNLHDEWSIADNFFTPLILRRDGKCYLCCYRVQCVMWQLLHKQNRAFQVPFKFPGFLCCHFSILAGFHSSWIFLQCLRNTQVILQMFSTVTHSLVPYLCSSPPFLSPPASLDGLWFILFSRSEKVRKLLLGFPPICQHGKKKNLSVCTRLNKKKLKRKTNSELKIWKVSDAVCCVSLRWRSRLNMKRMKFHQL